jgi:SAM-dependent methyltransferase
MPGRGGVGEEEAMDFSDAIIQRLKTRLEAAEYESVVSEFGELERLRPGRRFRAFYWAVDTLGLQAKLIDFPLAQPGSDELKFNSKSLKYFVLDGLSHASAINQIIDDIHGGASLDILDFGAGGGRLTWAFNAFADRHAYSACDVNPDAVEWIRNNLEGVSASTIPPLPPTDFEEDRFDLIYAWSIFTHYSEDAHLRWLTELSRIVKPGGTLVLTVKSAERVERFLTENKFQEQLDLSLLSEEEAIRKYRDTGYLYLHAYPESEARSQGIDAGTFGNTFISMDYVRETWKQFGEILEIRSVAPGFQDAVVLKTMK